MEKRNTQKSLAAAAVAYVKKEKGVEHKMAAYNSFQVLIFYKHVLRKLNRCSVGIRRPHSTPQIIKEMRLSEMEQLSAA